GSPVDLMIGGHQHQALFDPVMVGETAIVCAGYYGRWLGQLDLSVDPAAKSVEIVNYQLNTVTGAPTAEDIGGLLDEMYEDGLITNTGLYNSLVKKVSGAVAAFEDGKANAAAGKMRALGNEVAAQAGKKIDADAAAELLKDIESYLAHPADSDVAARIAYWAEIVAPIVNEPVGYTTIDLVRDYNNESNVGDIVTDSMLWKADEYDNGLVDGSVDIAFTNPGGLRANILIPDGASLPYTVTWGATFDVLPFGNQLFLMDLTGVQIQELVEQSAKLYKGILQTSGATYEWYNDTDDGEGATTWGATNVTVGGAALDPLATYRVVTNDFLAGGQDGWSTFADGANRWDTYFDMHAGFVEYIKALDDNTIDAEDIPMGRIVRIDVP
ncbi:MAG: bifunctional metallophosphatase/5'-nucleotidase, partial [Actinomycetota bacterium]|nr:bifunctional metallophosphatase/5'-nucleotidase [Actinomycetota bacterium]